MKPDTSPKRFPSTPEEWEALIAAAPETVNDPECPYDPNDAAAVEAFWSSPDAFVSHSLPELQRELLERREKRRMRGPNRAPTKERVTLRLSPEVTQFFKNGGRGWQTRVNDALREWVKTRAA